ncbi:MAG: AAA family ATPase [Cellulomonas sp.]|nr:DnaB-like helicase C-terminal domain-containing protein [Cellulomonas sp.]MCR6649732.1 AAA family ATPase [Cellulomonas sp.]
MDSPHDLDAERSVLASCMHSPDAITTATGMLTGDDFYKPAHEAIWNAITTLVDSGEPADEITVLNRLMADGNAAHLPALQDVIGGYITAANVRSHAKAVREHATRRRVIQAGMRAIQLGQGMEADPREIADTAAAEMTAAARPTVEDVPTIHDQINATLTELESTDPPLWQWPWLDMRHLLLPPRPGQFVLFAARPSVGKSVTLVDIARDVAFRQGQPVVLFSLEMGATEVMLRIIAAEERIPLTRLQTKDLTEDDWAKVARATVKIAASPLTIVDAATVGLTEVRAKVREHRPVVVLFDYVQLAKTRRGDRREVLEEVTRGLKILAKEERVTVVSAAQVSRPPKGREADPPKLSDLRETGALEQDADTVIIIHRPDMDDPESPRAGEVDMLVEKQRNGPRGARTLAAQLHYSRFVDLAA